MGGPREHGRAHEQRKSRLDQDTSRGRPNRQRTRKDQAQEEIREKYIKRSRCTMDKNTGARHCQLRDHEGDNQMEETRQGQEISARYNLVPTTTN